MTGALFFTSTTRYLRLLDALLMTICTVSQPAACMKQPRRKASLYFSLSLLNPPSLLPQVLPEEHKLIYRSSSSMVQVVKTRSFFPASVDEAALTSTQECSAPTAGVAARNDAGSHCMPRSRVVEHLVLSCPWLLKRTVKQAASDAHRAHMESYHNLFEQESTSEQS